MEGEEEDVDILMVQPGARKPLVAFVKHKPKLKILMGIMAVTAVASSLFGLHTTIGGSYQDGEPTDKTSTGGATSAPTRGPSNTPGGAGVPTIVGPTPSATPRPGPPTIGDIIKPIFDLAPTRIKPIMPGVPTPFGNTPTGGGGGGGPSPTTPGGGGATPTPGSGATPTPGNGGAPTAGGNAGGVPTRGGNGDVPTVSGGDGSTPGGGGTTPTPGGQQPQQPTGTGGNTPGGGGGGGTPSIIPRPASKPTRAPGMVIPGVIELSPTPAGGGGGGGGGGVPSPSGGAGGGGGGALLPVFSDVVKNAQRCNPSNGEELVYAVEEATCTVIWLLTNSTYVLPKEITVRRFVTIIGRPFDSPIVDAHNVRRAFMVERGGFLDCRFVLIQRGRPVEIIPELLYELRGSAVYIRLGGEATFTGVIFSPNEEGIPDIGISRTPLRQVRIMGSGVFMEGGILAFTGCHFYTSRPGVILPPGYALGGDVLILGGVGVFTGCTFTANFLFVSMIGAGVFTGILGGVGIFTGCTFTFSVPFVVGAGVGFNFFVGGGVGIFTGVIIEGNTGLLAFFGAGIGIFTGAGVSILTAVSFNSVQAISIGAGVGFNLCLGSGVSVKTAVTQSAAVAINFLATVGISTYIGSGTAVYTSVVFARVSALTSYNGIGGSLYIGSGIATLTAYASAAVGGLVATTGLGDVVLLAGFLTIKDFFNFKVSAIGAFFGQGDSIFVGMGSAVLSNLKLYVINAIGYAAPGTALIWIGGPVNYDQNPNSPNGDRTVFVKSGGQQIFLDGKPASNVTISNMTYRDHLEAVDAPRIMKLARIVVPDYNVLLARFGLAASNTPMSAVYAGPNMNKCSVCNVDTSTGETLTGPGADLCTLSDDCSTGDDDISSDLDRSIRRRSTLAIGGSGGSSGSASSSSTTDSTSSSGSAFGDSSSSGQGPTSLDRNTSLLILDLEAVLTPRDNVSTINTSIAAKAVASVTASLGLTSLDYTLKLVSTEIDPFLKDPLEDDEGGDSFDEINTECSRQVPLRAYFVSATRDVTKAIREAMLGKKTGTLLKNSLQGLIKPIQLCSFDVSGHSEYFVPGLGSYFPSVSSSAKVGSSMLVLDPEDGHLAQQLDIGGRYTVRFNNVQSGTKVVLSMVPFRGSKQQIATLSNKATAYDWTWTVGSQAVKGEQYFLEASTALGEFLSYSQGFKIAD